MKTMNQKLQINNNNFASKNLKITLAIIAFAFFTISCSKNDDPVPVAPPVVAEKTVNDITITTQRVSTPIAPNLGYVNNISGSWFQLVGNDILYSCGSGLGASNPQFMLKYNLGTNTFNSALPDSTVQFGGIINSFVTDNTNLFYIANQARKYNLVANTWNDIDYPEAIRLNTREAGMSFANGKIYACGRGSIESNAFKSYNITTNAWSNENDYLEDITIPELVTVQNKIYLLGGNAIRKNFSYFDITSNTWVAKTNLPFTMLSSYQSNIVAQAKNRYIFAFQGDKIYVYDIVKDQWKTEPILVPVTGNTALHLFGLNDTTLLITGVNINSRDFALYKLTLNLP